MEDEISDYEEEQERGRRGRTRSPSIKSSGSTSPVPSFTSTASSSSQHRRRSPNWDDLYDATDSESELEDDSMAAKILAEATKTSATKNRYPSLAIPSPRHWPTIQKLQKNLAVPPTPPAKIPISPAALSLLAQSPMTSSAPPSLDGSLSSGELANSTAPPTPDIQVHPDTERHWGNFNVRGSSPDNYVDESDEVPDVDIRLDAQQWDGGLSPLSRTSNIEDELTQAINEISEPARPESPILGMICEDKGVQLPACALETLRRLSQESYSEPQSAIECEIQEMREIMPARFSKEVDMTPASAVSCSSFSALSIPSPGGFFSSLGGSARNTWSTGTEPMSAGPPSSTTAEHFYNAPWNNNIIERTLTIDGSSTNGPPTAKQMPFIDVAAANLYNSFDDVQVESDAIQEIAKLKETVDFDEEYEKEIWHNAESTLDRTSVWLAAQTSYMAALRETNPANTAAEPSTPTRRLSKHIREDSLDSPMKRAVKFLDSQVAGHESPKTAIHSKADPLFYQAFQHVANATTAKDVFVHRQARFEAIQASRTTLRDKHIDELLGNYSIVDTERVAPQRPISMMPGKETEETAEQRVIARVEKERQALKQINTSTWVVEAGRYLNGGRLLNSPKVKALAASSKLEGQEQVRVLDLGGQAHCNWAWSCARDYPNAKMYTATSDQRTINDNLRGPSNHRLVRVGQLWDLPFPDNHFDVISARSLFTFLKNEKPLGATVDEYDMCLRECVRCLKPGGFLEFFVLDSEIVHSGPRGSAVSVEFGFNLRSRGYDPAPTKPWLGRVRRAGLVDIKRAWTFLPMGSPRKEAFVFPETPPPHQSMYEDQIMNMVAVQGPVGSSADAANISGLVGSWAWEQWMLKLQMEMGKESLLEGVGAVLEEGNGIGAGFRCLNGWARKPAS
ncbi:MAG: hypothetical protein MMC33_002281 [Icmadophila ericetorum]|nr:hypothetical protein [Icmadophila ericetorum]